MSYLHKQVTTANGAKYEFILMALNYLFYQIDLLHCFISFKFINCPFQKIFLNL